MSAALPHHPLLMAYLDSLRARGKATTAHTYDLVLGHVTRYLAGQQQDAATVTTDQLAAFQQFISTTYRTPTGAPLAKSTQATITAVVRSAYRFLHRRGLILHNPAEALALPLVPRRLVVAKDFLSQDECVALLNTLGAVEREAAPGTKAQALAQRNLALIAMALASGMRCHTLLGLRVAQLDVEQCTIRIETSKGKTGRVIPTATWAIAATNRFLADGRERLLQGASSDRVFVSQRRGHLCHKAMAYIVDEAIAETLRRNPDLDGLRTKHITTHSLRVSMALALHHGGCDLRSLSQLLLHGSAHEPGLSQTARYLPTTTADLTRALRLAHPRW